MSNWTEGGREERALKCPLPWRGPIVVALRASAWQERREDQDIRSISVEIFVAWRRAVSYVCLKVATASDLRTYLHIYNLRSQEEATAPMTHMKMSLM